MSAAKEFFFRQGKTRELVKTNDQGVTKHQEKGLVARQGSFTHPRLCRHFFQYPKSKHSFAIFHTVSKKRNHYSNTLE